MVSHRWHRHLDLVVGTALSRLRGTLLNGSDDRWSRLTEAQCSAQLGRERRYIVGTDTFVAVGPYRLDGEEALLRVFASFGATRSRIVLSSREKKYRAISAALKRIREGLREDAELPSEFAWPEMCRVLDCVYYQLIDYLLFGRYVEIVGGADLRVQKRKKKRIAGLSRSHATPGVRVKGGIDPTVDGLRREIRDDPWIEIVFDGLVAAVRQGWVGGEKDLFSRPSVWHTPTNGHREAKSRLPSLPCWGRAAKRIATLFDRVGYYPLRADTHDTIGMLFQACFGSWWGPESRGDHVRRLLRKGRQSR